MPIRSISCSYTVFAMRNEFGEWLRAEIKKTGKTQKEFSGLIGIEQPHLSRIISGDRGASTDTLKNIAKVLSIPEQTVLTQYGILSKKADINQKLSEATHILSMLGNDDLEEIIQIAKMKLDRDKREQEYKKQPSRSKRPARVR